MRTFMSLLALMLVFMCGAEDCEDVRIEIVKSNSKYNNHSKTFGDMTLYCTSEDEYFENVDVWFEKKGKRILLEKSREVGANSMMLVFSSDGRYAICYAGYGGVFWQTITNR